MKIAPLMREMRKQEDIEPVLLHTGQHYDEEMSDVFFKQLGIPEPNIYLNVGSGSHAEQTGTIMMKVEKILAREEPDLILVVGDVNSTLACSVTAAKMGIDVVHVEAGLRSFDRTMPEEINRIVTDSLSDLLFITEESAEENLLKEGVPGSIIHFVGNVMIDSLVYYRSKSKDSGILNQLGVEKSKYLLTTLHRPSNVDDREGLSNMLDVFEAFSTDYKIIFPIHPRSKKRIEEFELTDRVKKIENLILVKPLGYLDFLCLMDNARLVITDSGGIQEETTFLKVPCVTVRPSTERPITVKVGSNRVAGTRKENIIKVIGEVLEEDGRRFQIPKLWDGKAAERTVRIINEYYN